MVDIFNCDVWQEDCLRGEKCAAVPLYRDGIYEGWQCLPAGSTEAGGACSPVEVAPPGTDTCDADSICLGAFGSIHPTNRSAMMSAVVLLVSSLQWVAPS